MIKTLASLYAILPPRHWPFITTRILVRVPGAILDLAERHFTLVAIAATALVFFGAGACCQWAFS